MAKTEGASTRRTLKSLGAANPKWLRQRAATRRKMGLGRKNPRKGVAKGVKVEGDTVPVNLSAGFSPIPTTGEIPAFLVPDPGKRIDCYLQRFYRGNVREGSMLDRLCRYHIRCLEGTWTLRSVHQKKIPLTPRPAQLMLRAVMFDQAAAGQPIRVRVLKSRKTGISTDVQSFFVDQCSYYEYQIACTIAHEKQATRQIFKIGKFAAANCPESKAEIHRYDIEWEGNHSEYSCATAGGTAVGAGSTPNLLHISEGPKHGINKHETRYNSVTAVPDVPETVIIEEFTALGQDEYFTSWSEAAADSTHPYRAIFIPWMADPMCNYPVDENIHYPRTDEEQLLVDRCARMGYPVTNSMLEWRRRKIKSMPGGEVIFRQEFPSTPEEAVMGAEGLIVRGIRDCVVKDIPFDPNQCLPEEKVGGIDFGYMDPCVIWSGVFRDNTIWLTGFHRRARALAKDHVKALRADTTYYCDPAELRERLNFQEEVSKLGVRCRLVPAPRKKAPGEDLQAQELRFLVERIERGQLKILESCAKQLTCEADTFSWNEKTGKPLDSRSETVGHFDSIFALKYLCMGLQSRHKQGELSLYLPSLPEWGTRRDQLLISA